MNPRIVLLAFGTFTVGTEGYVVAGVLPALARDRDTSVAAAGQLVTVFALVYALAGPPLIGLLRSVPPRPLLVGAALVFAASNILAAVSTGIALLTVARMVAALSAALFAAPAAATAAALSTPANLSKAIAITASGNALALAMGAPIGTVIGAAVGWRGAFVFVAILAVLTAIIVQFGIPNIRASDAAVAGRLNLLRNNRIRWGLLTTLGIFLAAYSLYTYLAPVIGSATGMGSRGVAALMIAFGIGGLIGGRSIANMLRRFSIALVLLIVLITMAILLALLAVLTAIHLPAVAAIAVFPLMLTLGAAWWSGGITQQTRLAGLAPDQRAQALGLHFSAQFLGVAIGGAAGGLALASGGPVAIPIVACVIAMASLGSVRLTTPSRHAEDQSYSTP